MTTPKTPKDLAEEYAESLPYSLKTPHNESDFLAGYGVGWDAAAMNELKRELKTKV